MLQAAIRPLAKEEMAEDGEERVFSGVGEIAACFGTKPVDSGAKAV